MLAPFNSELFAHQLAGYSDFCKVRIDVSEKRAIPKVNVESGFLDKLPLPPFRTLPEDRMHANRETINYFYEQFGRERVLRIGERYRIAFENKYEQGAALRIRDIRRLFVGLADARYEDLIEHFHAKQLDGKFSAALSLQHLTNDDLDTLLNELIPFKRLEEIFLYRIPEVDPTMMASGITFDSRQQCIFLLEDLRRRRKDLTDDEWAVRMAKRLTNAQLPKGTLLAHRLGYYYLWGIISDEGAYKDCWKTITKSQNSPFLNLVAYRGTRVISLARDGPKTAIEDLRPDIGCRGIMATYDETHRTLFDPTVGFVKTADEKVRAIGMSLGGAHLQRDACLFLGKINNIITVSSVGIDEPTLKFFRCRANQCQEQVTITHIVDYDDVIPDFCDGHIGVDVTNTKHINIRYLSYQPLPELTPEERAHSGKKEIRGIAPARPSKARNWLEGLFHMQKALRGPHLRETHEEDHLVFVLSNQAPEEKEQLDRILHNKSDEHRANWETWRKLVARFGRPLEFVDFLESVAKPENS